MRDSSICRIGVFYDGSYFAYAQRFMYRKRKMGWMTFKPLHALIERYVREKEQGFLNYRIVHSSWTQGLFTSTSADERQLRNDRNLHHDLMHAGVDIKYLPISCGNREKGVDVAFAIDCLQVGLCGMIDIAVLVTGDGDMVPLVQSLNKRGIRVMAAHFNYADHEEKSFINERLKEACNYSLDLNSLEADKNYGAAFQNIFRRPEVMVEKHGAFVMS